MCNDNYDDWSLETPALDADTELALLSMPAADNTPAKVDDKPQKGKSRDKSLIKTADKSLGQQNENRTPHKKAPSHGAQEWRSAFLEAYAQCGTVTGASKQIGVARSAIYAALRDDPTLVDALAVAQEQFADSLERILFDMAKNGNFSAVAMALNGARPQKYRQNGTTVNVGAEIVVDLVGDSLSRPPGF